MYVAIIDIHVCACVAIHSLYSNIPVRIMKECFCIKRRNSFLPDSHRRSRIGRLGKAVACTSFSAVLAVCLTSEEFSATKPLLCCDAHPIDVGNAAEYTEKSSVCCKQKAGPRAERSTAMARSGKQTRSKLTMYNVHAYHVMDV